MLAFARKATLFSATMLVLLVAAMALPGQTIILPGVSSDAFGIAAAQPAASSETSTGAAVQPAESALTFTGAAAPFNLGVVLSDPGDIGSFESLIGRHVDIFLWYQSIDETLDTTVLSQVAAGGRTIQLSWNPIPNQSPVSVDPAHYRLTNISRGDFDGDIRRLARELRDFGYPVLLRPMSEMNGDWTTWSGNANGNTPADFIPAWRHIYEIFLEEGAANVEWIWSPNRDGSTADAIITYDNYYPGDAYVDYIGLSGYNWGTMYNTPTWISSWQDFEEVFGYSYDVMAARTSKPVILVETAATELGGDKAQWIIDAFAMIPTRFPRIVGVTWFNLNKETDWRVQSSAASLQAFKAAIKGIDAARGQCGIPGLNLQATRSYWANYADYGSRSLTVDFKVSNSGIGHAYDLSLYNSWSTNSATLSTALPVIVGNLAAGQSQSLTLKYSIPAGVTSYYTSIYATVKDGCGVIFQFPRMSSRI